MAFKKTLTGPGGIKLVLDHGDEATPAMVYSRDGKASSSYDCATGEGILAHDNGCDLELTEAQGESPPPPPGGYNQMAIYTGRYSSGQHVTTDYFMGGVYTSGGCYQFVDGAVSRKALIANLAAKHNANGETVARIVAHPITREEYFAQVGP